ncbi:MAG: hypothetical protein II308_06725, partial [Muribaculaceae bacterium]|nr:hypothetical protein [Muribaculaceae bacterium]
VLENFLINFFQPNVVFDAEKTQTNLKEKLQRERNVYKKIQKGQIIARRGDLVTEDNLPMLNAVLQNQKSITTRNIFSYALLNLLLFIFFALQRSACPHACRLISRSCRQLCIAHLSSRWHP